MTKEQVVIGQMVRTVVDRWDTSAGTIGRVDTVGCTFDRPHADLNSVSTKRGQLSLTPLFQSGEGWFALSRKITGGFSPGVSYMKR
jgi:hypothetical protein